MAQINLSARDIDLIGRVVDTEVPRSIARKNPTEYNRMVGAVVDTITNRLATGRYGKTVQAVLDQRRAFSKITGPARLNPYGSVTKAPKATFTAQNAVDNHIKGRIAGVPSIIGGALDYANPNFTDKKNLRGWVQPMIDAGAKMLGIGNAKHYHGLAPGNFPAPPTDIFGPQGFASHRGPRGPYNVSSPMRPDEANAVGPKGRFSLAPNLSAPVGKVTRAALGDVRAPTRSVPTQKTQPRSLMMGAALRGPTNDVKQNFPGMSIPADTASPRTTAKTLGGITAALANRKQSLAPDRQMPLGQINGSLYKSDVKAVSADRPRHYLDAAALSPNAALGMAIADKLGLTNDKLGSLPPDRPMPTGPVGLAPSAAIYDDPRALAYAQNMQPKVGLVPAAPSVVPQTLAQPKRVVQPIRQPLQITVRTPRAIAPTMPGGTLGGIRAQNRFSVGTGTQGITAAQGGVRGATGFSRSNPGMSVTSRGAHLGTITHNEKYGTDTFRDAGGNVTGTHYSQPGGFLGALGRSFGVGGSSGKSSSSGGRSTSSGKSGKSEGKSRGAAGGSLGQSQRSL